MQNAASASVGAVVTSLFVTPFEVLKVRQQACGSSACGMVQLGQTLVRAEGATAFWAGLRPTLLMAVPSTILYMGAYEHIRDAINERAQWLIYHLLPPPWAARFSLPYLPLLPR